MNTKRYCKRYYPAAEELIKGAENSVCPAEYYSAVPQLLEQAKADKLHLLFYRANTVVALENDEVVGFASADGQGGLGLLYVRGEEYKKTVRLLLKALEKEAVKDGVAVLSALPVDSAVKTLKDCGFALSENQPGKSLDGGNVRLEKRLAEAETPVTFPPEKSKRYVLDPKKPIKVEGKSSAVPYILFGIASFFAILLTILGIAGANGSPNVYGTENIPLFAVIIGLFFFGALTVLIWYFARYFRLKKQVLSMSVTNAVITDIVTDVRWSYTSDDRGEHTRYERVTLTFVYYNEYGELCEGRYQSRYDTRQPYFYKGQELIVAYAYGVSYILRKYTVLKEYGAQGEEVEIKDTAPKMSGNINPENYVPVAERKIYFVVSAAIFGMVAVVLGFLLVFGILTAKQTSQSLGKVFLGYLPFIAFVVAVLGGFVVFYLAVPLSAKIKYKKLRKSGAKFASGKLVCGDRTYTGKSNGTFYCEYVTESGETRRIKQSRMHVGELVKYGKTAVTVAYNGNTAVVLIKK